MKIEKSLFTTQWMPIKEQFKCANDKALKIINELDTKSGIGLIEKKRQGLGKPNRIYVKDFMSVFSDLNNRNPDFRKAEGKL